MKRLICQIYVLFMFISYVLIIKANAQQKQLSEGIFCKQSGILQSLHYSDKDTLITVDNDGNYKVARKDDKVVSCGKINNKFKSIAYSVDGQMAAVGYSRDVKIYDLQTGEVIHSLEDLPSSVLSIDFSPDEKAVLFGCTDGKVYQWDFQHKDPLLPLVSFTNADIERYVGHSAVISAVKYHPYGGSFFSADWNGVLSVWKPYPKDNIPDKLVNNIYPERFFSDEARRVVATRSSTEEISDLDITKDGEVLVLATSEGNLEFWRVRGLKKYATIKAHKGVIYDFDISPDGKSVVSCGRDGEIKYWDIPTNLDFISEVAGDDVLAVEPYKVVKAEGTTKIEVGDGVLYRN